MNKPIANNQPLQDSDARPLPGKEAKKPRKRGVVTKPTGERQKTTSSRAEERMPRLPHERDESADSQVESAVESPDAAVSRQAFEDVDRGLVNTDKGLEGSTIEKETSTRRNDKCGNI